MTLQEVYKKCKAWMFEKNSSSIYNNYIIDIANEKLAELFEENNMCRMFYGKKPLKTIPQCTSLQDELGIFNDDGTETGLGIMPEYQYEVLPLGIVAEFLMDDDLNKMSRFDTKYNNARVMHQKIVSMDKIKELESDNATEINA